MTRFNGVADGVTKSADTVLFSDTTALSASFDLFAGSAS